MLTCTLLLLSLAATGEDVVGWVSDPTEPHAETQMDGALGSEPQPTPRGPLRRLLDRWRNRPTPIIDRLTSVRDLLQGIALWICVSLILWKLANAAAKLS
jgi:hypothetical protein